MASDISRCFAVSNVEKAYPTIEMDILVLHMQDMDHLGTEIGKKVDLFGIG